MASVVQLPSGRFRAFARVKALKATQVFDNIDVAERWAQATESRMRQGKWRASAVVLVQPNKTVKDAFAAYVESEQWLQKADVTRKVEQNKQKPVIAELGSLLLTELTRDDIGAYIAKRRKSKPTKAVDDGARLSPDQIRLEVAALSSMCNFAVDMHWLESNPVRGVKRPTSTRRTTRISDEIMGKIIENMINVADEKAYLFFRLLFSTLCRPGELASAKRIWLRGSPAQLQLPRTKNEDERNIIIPEALIDLVKLLMKDEPDCPYIFGTKKIRGDGWSPYNYAYAWKKAKKRMELGGLKIVPHMARHEGISRLFERTKLSDGQIAAISGHRSSQALWRYKHLRAEHSRPFINALDKQVANAINRSISQMHPSEPLQLGEMLKPIMPAKKKKGPKIIDWSKYEQAPPDYKNELTDE